MTESIIDFYCAKFNGSVSTPQPWPGSKTTFPIAAYRSEWAAHTALPKAHLQACRKSCRTCRRSCIQSSCWTSSRRLLGIYSSPITLRRISQSQARLTTHFFSKLWTGGAPSTGCRSRSRSAWYSRRTKDSSSTSLTVNSSHVRMSLVI